MHEGINKAICVSMLGGLVEYESENDSSGCDSPRKPMSPKANAAVSNSGPIAANQPEVHTAGSDLNISSTADLEEQSLVYLSNFPNIPANIRPSPDTLASIKHHSDEMKMHNFNLVERIRSRRDFGNPYILSKVVEDFHIDQYGTNYPPDLFDPKNYPESDYHESMFRGNVPDANLVPVAQSDVGFSGPSMLPPVQLQQEPVQPQQAPPPPQLQQQQQQQPTMSRYQAWLSANSAAQQGGPSSSSSTSSSAQANQVNSIRVNRTASYNQSLSDITSYATALSVGVTAVYGERSSGEKAFDYYADGNSKDNNNGSSSSSSTSGRVTGEKRKSRWDTAENS